MSDLVTKTVDNVVKVASGEAFSVQDGPKPTSESVTARVRSYEAACSTLLAMATVGGFWAEKEHYPVWQRALERLGSTKSSGGTVRWLALQRYPATLLLYALESARSRLIDFSFSDFCWTPHFAENIRRMCSPYKYFHLPACLGIADKI